MIESEERFLVDGVKRLTKTLADLLDVTQDRVIVCGPSRHIVVRSEDGQVIAKLYKDHEEFRASERLLAEQQNLRQLHQINKEREPLFRKVNGSEFDYIGLPDIDTTRLDTSRLVTPGVEIPISFFSVIQGTLLYDSTLQGSPKFEDYLRAAVQIARIQQEGKLEQCIKLKNIVRDRGEGEPVTAYFMKRFQKTFLEQLVTYGGIGIPKGLQDEMAGEWETLVAQNLVKAHRDGFTGYYFDGNPKHHVLDSDRRKIVSLDYEDRLLTPALLGLASLLSFGLGKDGKPLFDEKEIEKILDRYLLEIEFVNALRHELKDKATRLTDYIKQAEDHGHDLAGYKPDEYFRFLGREGDRNEGVAYRNKFLTAWRFAELDRQVSWLAHKARYRAVAETLSRENGFRFEHPNPVQQNAAEQRQHLQRIIAILEGIVSLNGKNNGREAHYAAMGLVNKFGTYFVNNNYFLPR